jgi:hypothetical protein
VSDDTREWDNGYAEGYDDGASMVQQSLDDTLDAIRVLLSQHRERMRKSHGNLCAIRARTIAAIEQAVKF